MPDCCPQIANIIIHMLHREKRKSDAEQERERPSLRKARGILGLDVIWK